MLYATYNLEDTKSKIVGGDGAAWVRNTFDLFGIKQECHVLDSFHVRRSIRSAFADVLDTGRVISQLYEQGFQSVEKLLLDSVPSGNRTQVKSRLN